MTSFFSKLFGVGPKEPEQPVREDPVEHEGFSIVSAPQKNEDGQWRLCGYIVKAGDEGSMERFYLRADSYPSREQAVEFCLRKGKQIVKEQGATMFSDGEASGRV